MFFRFIEERLGLLWREWLTGRSVDRYLGAGIYNRLKERGELGNPDQRITDDIRSFTASTLSFVLMWLNGTFTILAFSGVMWSISPLCSSWPSRTRRQRRGPRLLLSGSIVPVWFGSVASIQWRSSTKLGVVFHTPDREDYVVRALSEIPVQPRQLPAGSPR